MCFSVESSFAATAVLLPTGAYCVLRAVRKDSRFLPLALTPIAFAVQQAAEGCVWYGFRHHRPGLVEGGTIVFLFFAVAFWPFWAPFSLLFVERRRPAKMFLHGTTVLSLCWFCFYIHAAVFPGRELHTHVVRHSIDYGLADLRGFRDAPLIVWRLAYLLFICGPLLLVRAGGEARWRFCAGLVAALFVVSDLVYWYAFASVWCFFAAVSSLLLALAFAKLPVARGQRTATTPGCPSTGIP
jgi:hypothetical protein